MAISNVWQWVSNRIHVHCGRWSCHNRTNAALLVGKVKLKLWLWSLVWRIHSCMLLSPFIFARKPEWRIEAVMEHILNLQPTARDSCLLESNDALSWSLWLDQEAQTERWQGGGEWGWRWLEKLEEEGVEKREQRVRVGKGGRERKRNIGRERRGSRARGRRESVT